MHFSKAATAYLPSLTSLRGIAAFWVVLYHYFQYFQNLHPERYARPMARGYLAVDLFFMLSGFVMTHVYHYVFTKRVDAANYWSFLAARIARLYPVHLTVLSLFLATAIAFRVMAYTATGTFQAIPLEGARSLSALVANLFMLQGIHASALSWDYPAWSISLEFMAYLAFPFLLHRIWRTGALSKIVLAAGLFAALGWLAYLTDDHFDQWDGPQTLLRCLPEFLLGTLLYCAFRAGTSVVGALRDTAVLGIFATLIASLYVDAPDLLIVGLFAVLVPTTVLNRGRVAILLNSGPLTWLGNISYSLYLVHGFVQYLTTKLLSHGLGINGREDLSRGGSLLLLAAMVGISLLLATYSCRYIEDPGRRYLRRALSLKRAQARIRESGSIRRSSPIFHDAPLASIVRSKDAGDGRRTSSAISRVSTR